MNLTQSPVYNILKKLTQYRVMTKLRQLRAVDNIVAKRIENSLKDALNNNLSPEEKVWIERIEEVRKALDASLTEITITDYGLGSPNLNRTEEEMYEGVVTTTTVSKVCKASKSNFWALILFKLVREFQPSMCIELGTCVGISAAYQAAAQKLNNKGRITTLEGAASLASLSANNLQQLGLDNAVVITGRFQDNLERVLNENKPIDYAFIDGHHDGKATISYFESFIPYLAKQSIIVFDDISWSDSMYRAWHKIIENENIKIAVDLKKIGICVLDDDMENKFSF